MFSAFIITVLVPGFTNGFGIIFSDIMKTFDSSRTETSAVQLTMLGVGLTSGLSICCQYNRVDRMFSLKTH